MLIVNQQTLTSQSVASNTQVDFTATPTAITGYKPIGVAGAHTLDGVVFLVGAVYNASDDQIIFTVRNNYTSSRNVAPRVDMLYIRSI